MIDICKSLGSCLREPKNIVSEVPRFYLASVQFPSFYSVSYCLIFFSLTSSVRNEEGLTDIRTTFFSLLSRLTVLPSLSYLLSSLLFPIFSPPSSPSFPPFLPALVSPLPLPLLFPLLSSPSSKRLNR